ncbi:MAG: hypothetical protein M1817_004646 [Caeruleum heppii]|nr:MAG: hypothetical protein M1817_004646 [Caeruleum heppii]
MASASSNLEPSSESDPSPSLTSTSATISDIESSTSSATHSPSESTVTPTDLASTEESPPDASSSELSTAVATEPTNGPSQSPATSEESSLTAVSTASETGSTSSSSFSSLASESSIEPLPSSTASPVGNGPQIRFAAGSSIISPQVVNGRLHGPSRNDPTSQYLRRTNSQPIELANNLLTIGVNGFLTSEFSLAADTGVLAIDDTVRSQLTDLRRQPHLSRDGGKGGYLNGQSIFTFCDTGSYTQPSEDSEGEFLGFVASSVAVDRGSNGMDGEALVLVDGEGEWSDDAGRMRGFAPLTEGEQSYNLVMQGQGQRYAIWPESSLIPYNQTTALLYAPIVYDNVDQVTRDAVFTYAGTTLLAVTAPTEGGPRAQRLVTRIFSQYEVEWGTIAGLRSYGASGVGGNDGRVYVFGVTRGGLLIGRVDADSITDRSAYRYWDGFAWGAAMQPADSRAWFLEGAFMDGDLFYSPAHLTFIFVFLNPYADNTFYFRYLETDRALRPSWAVGEEGTDDIAEALVQNRWSEPEVLFRAQSGPTGRYIYAGGVHQGYFGEDDISNGGRRMLLSWTAPTGENPASEASEYAIVTADVEFA